MVIFFIMVILQKIIKEKVYLIYHKLKLELRTIQEVFVKKKNVKSVKAQLVNK